MDFQAGDNGAGYLLPAPGTRPGQGRIDGDVETVQFDITSSSDSRVFLLSTSRLYRYRPPPTSPRPRRIATLRTRSPRHQSVRTHRVPLHVHSPTKHDVIERQGRSEVKFKVSAGSTFVGRSGTISRYTTYLRDSAHSDRRLQQS